MAYRIGLWKDNCCICGRERTFTIDCNLYRFRRKGKRCNSCARRGQKRTPEQRKRISEGTKRSVHQPEIRRKILDGNARPDVRLRRRNARLQQIQLSGQRIEFNRSACEFFDFLNIINGWNGRHALDGGEYQVIGYSLDYYEPNINLVIEWDEKHHYNMNGHLRKKDKLRQKEIEQHLQCTFLRIKETDVL